MRWTERRKEEGYPTQVCDRRLRRDFAKAEGGEGREQNHRIKGLEGGDNPGGKKKKFRRHFRNIL